MGTRRDALYGVQGGGGWCALLQYTRLTTSTYGPGPPAPAPGPLPLLRVCARGPAQPKPAHRAPYLEFTHLNQGRCPLREGTATDLIMLQKRMTGMLLVPGDI